MYLFLSSSRSGGALACLLAASACLHAHAQEVVANGSFETNNLGSGTYLYGSQAVASPWTFSNNAGSGIAHPVAAGTTGFVVNGAVPDGNTFAILRNSSTSTYAGGSITQTLNFSAAGTYLLSFYEGGRVGASGNVTFSVDLGGLTLTPVGSSPVSSANTVTPGQAFTQEQYTVNVSAPNSYNLTFLGISGTGSDAAYLDNVSVVAVPEPATWAGGIGAAALLGLGLYRRGTRQA